MITRLIDDGHSIKLQESPIKNFVSPIVITEEKDENIKLAVETRELNEQLHKNKYRCQISTNY